MSVIACSGNVPRVARNFSAWQFPLGIYQPISPEFRQGRVAPEGYLGAHLVRHGLSPYNGPVPGVDNGYFDNGIRRFDSCRPQGRCQVVMAPLMYCYRLFRQCSTNCAESLLRGNSPLAFTIRRLAAHLARHGSRTYNAPVLGVDNGYFS